MLGAIAGSTSTPLSAEWRTSRSATGSPPTSRGFTSAMLPPICAQHREQSGAGRIEADVLDRQLASRHQQRGDDEERGRGGIARHVDRLRPQLRLAADADHAGAVGLGLDLELGAEAAQHPLGMVARRHRLDHAW